MSFNFDNFARPVGSRGSYTWYQWKVFMKEPKDKLNKVKSVEYRLHKTFPNSIRVVEDRNSKFALTSAGWGEFLIRITIHLKDGTEKYGEYLLNLGKSWPSDEP